MRLLRAALAAFLAAALTACGPRPPGLAVAVPAASELPAPELVPLDPLLAEFEKPARARGAGIELVARGGRLSRTRIARPEAGGLAERGRTLRARAETLRAMPL